MFCFQSGGERAGDRAVMHRPPVLLTRAGAAVARGAGGGGHVQGTNTR